MWWLCWGQQQRQQPRGRTRQQTPEKPCRQPGMRRHSMRWQSPWLAQRRQRRSARAHPACEQGRPTLTLFLRSTLVPGRQPLPLERQLVCMRTLQWINHAWRKAVQRVQSPAPQPAQGTMLFLLPLLLLLQGQQGGRRGGGARLPPTPHSQTLRAWQPPWRSARQLLQSARLACAPLQLHAVRRLQLQRLSLTSATFPQPLSFFTACGRSMEIGGRRPSLPTRARSAAFCSASGW